jgi:carbon monoxide dehydrogenase subunit G
MPQLRPARTISVSIAAPAAEVYAFVADPRRLPKWATGLGSTPTPLSDGAWRVETPAGPMRVVFAPPNDFGVVDHVVSALPGGDPVADVPLRVVSNGNGSEVMLTVFQQPGMSDAQFASDTALVQADLERLKHAVEHGPR